MPPTANPHTEATAMTAERITCPDHPRANVNDFGGVYVLCAICSRKLPKFDMTADLMPYDNPKDA